MATFTHAADCASWPQSVDQYDPEIQGWVERRLGGGECNCHVSLLKQQEAEIQRLNCSWEQTIRERNAIQELLTTAQEGWDAAHEAATHYMNEPCTECRRLRTLIEDEIQWLAEWVKAIGGNIACAVTSPDRLKERAKVLEEKLDGHHD